LTDARRVRLAALTAALLVVGLAALAVLARPAKAAPGKHFYGITPATQLSDEEYAWIANGGVRALRMPFFWEDIQPTGRRQFDWRTTDRMVGAAAAEGILVQPFVMGVPTWLVPPDARHWPPLRARAIKAWRALLAALVERYGPGGEFWELVTLFDPTIAPRPIRTWQIWNESNARTYWRPGRSAPERYARLLQISDRVLERVDPGAKVISAGLFEMPSDGMRSPKFISRLYQAPGAASSFDALGLHPYARVPRAVTDQIELVREIMKRNGDRRKPIWITELGWPTSVVVGGGYFAKTEEGQARALRRTFNRILNHRGRWRVKRVVWYTWRDNDLFGACNLCRYSGLMRQDLTPKPAWRAFVRFTGGSPKRPEPAPAEASPAPAGAAVTPTALRRGSPLTSARGR
jgi:hypothetical protein